jgi:hydrogenase maturation protein HypF
VKPNVPNNGERHRQRIVLQGAVQGVGFRPFVYRLAYALGITGWVTNTAQGVLIEAEGTAEPLEDFLRKLRTEKPPHAFIHHLDITSLPAQDDLKFEIHHSNIGGSKTAFVLPDLSTCPDCLTELFDPSNRRYRYPFTNCTNCGPRFSIIEALPYDRSNTSMRHFPMCPACQAEYDDPLDRRFHAEPNACPTCGPQLELWDGAGTVLASRHEALLRVVEQINLGKIVALKGIGGFQLIVDARNDEAVKRLRGRKHREEKPLALMFSSLETVRRECTVSGAEQDLLRSAESPIVLLERVSHAIQHLAMNANPQSLPSSKTLRQAGAICNPQSLLAPSVAPNNPYLGIMLPYSPLHHLLMRELRFPVVATSGNLSDEPMCTDEREALRRLSSIADSFLVHNRPIVRHVDDSITRIIELKPMMFRRARGYAPLPVPITRKLTFPVLAVGAHLKNTVALAMGENVFVSQHLGDLETQESLDAFHHVIQSFEKLYDAAPAQVVCDLHPDYASTAFARATGVQCTSIQHHEAHVAACMAENRIEDDALGIAWDGTGFGLDSTIWGGEFFLANDRTFTRVASLRPFRLPGGEAAVQEPRRTAFGLLYEIFGEGFVSNPRLPTIQACSETERKLFVQMLRSGNHAPVCSSAGRLFDAVASILDIRQRSSFEGQAAMELEFEAMRSGTDRSYHVELRESATVPLIVNWEPMVREILHESESGTSRSRIAAKFHNTMAEVIVAVARRFDERQVVLTGGCFQNKYLLERAIRNLRNAGYTPYWHHQIPTNDGGISFGQIIAALRLRSGHELVREEAWVNADLHIDESVTA